MLVAGSCLLLCGLGVYLYRVDLLSWLFPTESPDQPQTHRNTGGQHPPRHAEYDRDTRPSTDQQHDSEDDCDTRFNTDKRYDQGSDQGWQYDEPPSPPMSKKDK